MIRKLNLPIKTHWYWTEVRIKPKAMLLKQRNRKTSKSKGKSSTRWSRDCSRIKSQPWISLRTKRSRLSKWSTSTRASFWTWSTRSRPCQRSSTRSTDMAGPKATCTSSIRSTRSRSADSTTGIWWAQARPVATTVCLFRCCLTSASSSRKFSLSKPRAMSFYQNTSLATSLSFP